MTTSNVFFSPYSLDTSYCIVASGKDASALAEFGAQVLYHNSELFGMIVPAPWPKSWEKIAAVPSLLAAGMQLAVISCDSMPQLQEIELSLRPAHELAHIAKNLWLADYLNADRLVCFMQPVFDRQQQEVGYEAFARIEAPDNSLIGGGAIMEASHALHIEYQVDRAMHKLAIDKFAEAKLNGMIFINFLTGFVHRPEVYLDGLNQAVNRHHMLPRTVALDVSLPDYARSMDKLESIANYCRERGFLISLDDVMTPDGLAGLLQTIRPAVVKLDAKLGPLVLDPQSQKPVVEIIRLAHAAGAVVLAEGIENGLLHETYMAVGVDMFQGYHLGKPKRY